MECVSSFFELELNEWISANLKREFTLGTGSVDAQVLFGALCCVLWKNKNEHVFNQRSGRGEDMIRAVDCFATNVYVAYRENMNIRAGRVEKIKWSPPSSGWINVNSNRATSTDGGWLVASGVLRDSYGN